MPDRRQKQIAPLLVLRRRGEVDGHLQTAAGRFDQQPKIRRVDGFARDVQHRAASPQQTGEQTNVLGCELAGVIDDEQVRSRQTLAIDRRGVDANDLDRRALAQLAVRRECAFQVVTRRRTLAGGLPCQQCVGWLGRHLDDQRPLVVGCECVFDSRQPRGADLPARLL